MGDFILYPHEIPDQSDVDTTERNLKMNQCVFMSAVMNIPCTCFIHVYFLEKGYTASYYRHPLFCQICLSE